MLYLGRFFADLAKLLVLGKFVLGHSLKLNKMCLTLTLGIFFTAMFILSCQSLTDVRVIYKTLFLITIYCSVFSFPFIRKLLNGILLKILIDITDSLIFGVVMLLVGHSANDRLAGAMITIGSTSISVIFAILCYKRREEVSFFLRTLALRWYLGAFFCVLCAAGLTGYAQDFVMRDGSISRLDKVGFICAGLLGLFFIFVLIMLLGMKKQKEDFQRLSIYNEMCLESQAKQYVLIGKKDDALRVFKHDFNAHLNMIGHLVLEENYDEVKQYIAEIQRIKASTHLIKTKNLIVDAILNQYCEVCQRDNITCSVTGEFPDSLNLSQSELCTLFSNAMRNAYEAASRCNKGRTIDVKIGTYENYVDVEITNSTDKLPRIDGKLPETTKNDKINHGIGTKNMTNIVEAHGGSIEWVIISKEEFAVHFSWYNR